MIQDSINVVVVYRPRFTKPGRWFAWVAKDPADAHKPVWARRLVWWPISHTQAMEWYDNAQRVSG